ncbi:protein LKAAEAR1 isoform X2 [Vulpes vulpes]|uniref:Protein LKAAEAR1 isoform X2 n=1 Tax=Vulpes vulpes TaxID=9627 RepID=A0ABM4YM50_VULVU
MPAPAAKGAGRGGPRGPREGTSSEERARRAPAAKPPGPGAAPSPEGRAAMPHPRAWGRPLEGPAVRQDLLLGVLKAAEARGRIRALRLRYIRLRQQESARAAIRLELLLPPQLKPTRIPDPLDRQEVRAGPGGAERGVPASARHPAPPFPPAEEARGDHPGGESRGQHLPTLTAPPRGRRPHAPA